MYDEYEPGWNAAGPTIGDEGSLVADAILTGAPNDLPVISSNQQTSVDSPFTTFRQLLGSIGSVAQSARDVGTAVGTVQRDIDNAGKTYNNARVNARTGNSAAQWWNYSNPTDKMMIVLAALGVAVAIYVAAK